ncbi:C4-dicarboxylate ABC transporter permease [Roseospira marina]|uniref:C4-dicarboxylate ABC transporter permease n=1 Tax=Roseospira marina TaxID=140057 RepID=A0A5M6I829_9PROT|nr:tripartite tricarboxylate transporter permease [Roseospira marina]KAA5604302.1 C4-dicarboxylate ABC transporter permease [Roseospira marina]MBB4315674.1 TctA family transporter [Roseospira marina]MBB5088732.1 TctA family transporter [Roseospira marina]
MTADALALLLTPQVLAAMAGAALAGLIVGALPGLTATLGMALLIPVAVTLDPVPALAAAMTLAAVSIAAGDLPGALLGIPGTPASAAYADAAHRMARRGHAGRALAAGLVCAALGGVTGAVVLWLGAPVLATLALHVSTVERAWLALLGLSAAAAVAGPSPVRGALALLIGLSLALVGLDPVSGQPRLTFGLAVLSGGLGLVPVLVGLFAVTRVLRQALTGGMAADAPRPTALGPVLSGLCPILARRWRALATGSAVGLVVGAVPGAGADVAAYLARAAAGRRRPARGAADVDDADLDAIVPAGAANNAAIGGALVPATVLGLPGDSLTAIVIGLLMLKGVTPGPAVFVIQPTLMTAVVLAYLLANLLLVPAGLLAMALARPLLRVPDAILMPLVLGLALIGVYAVEGTTTALVVTVVVGLLGVGMEAARLPLAPAVLGFVLGPMVEEAALVSLMKSGGDPAVFVGRPLAAVLAGVTVAVWVVPWIAPRIVRRVGRRRRTRALKR